MQEAWLVLRVIQTSQGRLVNVCDRELVGKTFEEKGIVLRLSEEFYGGKLVEDDVALEEMRRADILTLVGERAVSLAIRERIIHPVAVMRVCGIPYAMYMNTLL